MFTNLFPTTLKEGAIEIFGEQSMQPVLIELLPAPISTTDPVIDLLHQNEAGTLSGYKFSKRRSEYLTGRICAKIAVQEFFNLTATDSTPPLMSEIEIARMENERPKVYVHPLSNNTLKLDISISHSGNYGAALAAGSYCGIDIQLRQNSLLKVQEKYCSETEYRLLEAFLTDTDELTRLALLWTAKEAAQKTLSHWQMPGFLDLEAWELQSFANYSAFTLRITNIKSQLMPQHVTVVAGMFGDYALAICLISEDH
jgi:phosphopantetheinyl transferase (holo-ACP synthase)